MNFKCSEAEYSFLSRKVGGLTFPHSQGGQPDFKIKNMGQGKKSYGINNFF